MRQPRMKPPPTNLLELPPIEELKMRHSRMKPPPTNLLELPPIQELKMRQSWMEPPPTNLLEVSRLLVLSSRRRRGGSPANLLVRPSQTATPVKIRVLGSALLQRGTHQRRAPLTRRLRRISSGNMEWKKAQRRKNKRIRTKVESENRVGTLHSLCPSGFGKPTGVSRLVLPLVQGTLF